MNAFLRPFLVRLHRWFGLAIALFLFVAGLTGALIAWDHELDAALNPDFYTARSDAAPLDPLALATRIEPPTRACSIAARDRAGPHCRRA